MVKVFSAIVGHGHNVGVVVLVVVIKAVKEKAQSDPAAGISICPFSVFFRTTKN